MAKSYFPIHTQTSSILLPFKLFTIFYVTHIILCSFILTFTSNIPVTPTDTENYLLSNDPNITNLMVSHYGREKQHNPKQFTLINVKQCTEAPFNIQHATVEARVYVRAKVKCIEAYKCVA